MSKLPPTNKPSTSSKPAASKPTGSKPASKPAASASSKDDEQPAAAAAAASASNEQRATDAAAPVAGAPSTGSSDDDDDDDDEEGDAGQKLAIPLKEANRLRRMAGRLEKKARAIAAWQKTENVDTSVVGKSLLAVSFTLTEAARSLESLPPNYKRGPGGGGGPAKPVAIGSKVRISDNKRVIARYDGILTTSDTLEVTGLRRDGKDVVLKREDGTTLIIPRAHVLGVGETAAPTA